MSARTACALAALTLVFVFHARRTAIHNYTGGGDSPYYVLMARSLARDGDLLLTPAERSLDGNLEDCPVFLPPRLVSSDRPYCWHPIGAPLLFAVPYALGGRPGILLFTALLGGLTAALMWLYLYRASQDDDASLVATLAIGLSVPYLPLATNEYTEMPALFAQMIGLLSLQGLARDRPDRARLLVTGLVAAWLPWIHLRYLWIALGLVLSTLAIRRERQSLIFLLVVPVLSAAGLYAWAWYVTGELGPTTVLGLSGANRPETISMTVMLKQGLWGHLVDQQGGILVHSPHLAFALVGLVLAAGSIGREIAVNLACCIPTLATVAGYYDWSGHWGVPCRFLASLLPLAGLGLVIFVRRVYERLPASLPPVTLPVVMTGFFSLAYLRYPPLELSLEGPGVNLDACLVYLRSRTGIDLLAMFPRFIYEPTGRDYALAASLLACAALWLAWAHRVLTLRRWRLLGVLAVASVAFHWEIARATRPPVDPLQEDGRWWYLDPEYLLSYPRLYMDIAVSAKKASRYSRSRRALTRILEVNPTHLEARAMLVDLLAMDDRTGARALAAESLKVARQKATDDREARVFVACFLHVLGEDARAREEVDRYLERPGREEARARELEERISRGAQSPLARPETPSAAPSPRSR